MVFHKIEYIPHTTLIFTGKANIVRYLCAAGANLTMRGDDGMTCLHLAAQNGHLECVHVIMGQNNLPRKFLNLQDEGGWTPLVWACENKHEEVIGYVGQKILKTPARRTREIWCSLISRILRSENKWKIK